MIKLKPRLGEEFLDLFAERYTEKTYIGHGDYEERHGWIFLNRFYEREEGMLTEEQEKSMPIHLMYWVNRVNSSIEQQRMFESMFKKMNDLKYEMIGVAEHSYNYVFFFRREKK